MGSVNVKFAPTETQLKGITQLHIAPAYAKTARKGKWRVTGHVR